MKIEENIDKNILLIYLNIKKWCERDLKEEPRKVSLVAKIQRECHNPINFISELLLKIRPINNWIWYHFFFESKFNGPIIYFVLAHQGFNPIILNTSQHTPQKTNLNLWHHHTFKQLNNSYKFKIMNISYKNKYTSSILTA